MEDHDQDAPEDCCHQCEPEPEDDYGLDMQAALEADGEKLRQLTGEDHGPFTLPAPPAGEMD